MSMWLIKVNLVLLMLLVSLLGALFIVDPLAAADFLLVLAVLSLCGTVIWHMRPRGATHDQPALETEYEE